MVVGGFPARALLLRRRQPKNPYNFSECRVAVTIEQPTSGGTVVSIDGFYMTEFKRSFVNHTIRYAQHEVLEAGRSGWYIRWSAQHPGLHRYSASAICNASRPVFIVSRIFRVVATADALAHGGWVRPSSNRRHFELSHSHASYVPIGQDIAWPTIFNGSFDTDRWMGQLADHGGNFARVWLCASLDFARYGHDIARNEDNKTRPCPQAMVALEQSAFVYDQRAAWRFDQTLRTARQHGMRVLATLESFSTLRTPPAEYADWAYSVYNAENNGSLKTKAGDSAAAAFFKHGSGASEQFSNRMRYIIARYGWSPEIMGLEVWNELTNAFTPVDPKCKSSKGDPEWCQYNLSAQDVQSWHANQRLLIKTLDHSRHMVTTSFPALTGDRTIEGSMEFSTTHMYDKADMARSLAGLAEEKAERYDKPSFIGECGVHPQANDPTGISLENALWAPLFRQAAGASACWFWNYWVPHYNLYGKFRGVRTFVDTVPWAEMVWQDQNHTFSRIPDDSFVTGLAGTPLSDAQAQGGVPKRPTFGLIFMHAKNYTWFFQNWSVPLRPIGKTVLNLHGMVPGCYNIRWFDCTQGSWFGNATVACVDHETRGIRVSTPVFRTNAAATLRLIV
eukprot:SAG31_NODE_724_length_12555_cov_11.624277_2_plen_619_part_00